MTVTDNLRVSNSTLVELLTSVLLAGLWLVGSAAATFAQTTSGGVRGVVLDANGSAIPGASVAAKNVATGVELKTTSTAAGLYVIPRILPGIYQLSAEAASFKKASFTDVEVAAGKDTVVDFKLEPGAITEVVTVAGGAESLVEKDTAQISTNFQARKVQELPVNVPGRGLDVIALLAPGVTIGFGNVNGNGTTLSANGQRARSNNFTIDGVDNNDLAIGGPSFFVRNPEVVGEFQVITNNFSAEYGRNQGAIVNIVSKAGTNQFHGNGAWEHLDAANFNSLTNLQKRAGRKEPPASLDNIFSYAVGGPVIKNKVFFFTTGWFRRNPAQALLQANQLSPTTAGIQALKTAFPNNPAIQYYTDFSALALPLGNPRIRPDVAPSTVTIGGVTVPVAAVERTVAVPVTTDEYTGRGDATLSEKHRFWGRYFRQKNPGKDALAAANGFTGDNPQFSRQAGGGWTWTISNRLVSEFRFNYSRLFVLFGGGDAGGKGQIPEPKDVGTAHALLNSGFTAANGTPLLAVGPQNILPQGRDVKAYQFTENLALTWGNHQLKLGADFRKLLNFSAFLANTNGNYTFANAQELVSNAASGFVVAFGASGFEYKEFDQFYYFQDDWRIRPNLTLNLGARYEYSGQPFNQLNEYTTVRESNPATAFWRQSLPVEARVVPRIPPDKNNFAPRFGLVYSPRFSSGLLGRLIGADKTTVRGGFGLAYDATFYNLLSNVSIASPVAFATNAVGVAIPDANPTGDKVRAAASSLIRFNTFDPRLLNRTSVNPHFHSPYSEQWSLGIQRELPGSQVFEIRYVGTHGVGLLTTINQNPFLGNLVNGFSRNYFDPATSSVKALNFPGFPQLFPGVRLLNCPNDPATLDNEAICNGRLQSSGIARERINGAHSVYHGLQTRYDGRLRNQWLYGFSYTWSHTLDNASEVFSFAGGNSVTVSQNPLDLGRPERGNSGFDARHAFASNFIWNLPWLKEQKGWLGRLAGGWQINGILRVQSGRLFTPGQVLTSRNPYEDVAFMAAFINSQSHFRPFSGNPQVAPNLVAISDVDACLFYGRCGTSGGNPIFRPSSTGFYLLNDLNRATPVFTSVTPNDVRFIVNGAGAAQKFGTPFGNVGRNSFIGDRIEQFDLSIFKTFRITERVNLQYRFQAINALNHPNFGIPASINLDNAGSTFFNFQENNGGNRVISMGLRLTF